MGTPQQSHFELVAFCSLGSYVLLWASRPNILLPFIMIFLRAYMMQTTGQYVKIDQVFFASHIFSNSSRHLALRRKRFGQQQYIERKLTK
jgi:hypothetical protein